jgi:hypothetical protein
MTDEPGSGKVATGDNLGSHSISLEDVAATVVAILDEQQTYQRAIDLVSGSTPIAEAVRQG